MVRRILSRITAPIRSLHQAAYVLAGLTLAAQLLSLLRDRVFASAFGAGEVLDLYYAAFKVPDLVFALIASLVSAYVLIPRLARSESAQEARELIGKVSVFLVVAGGLLSLALAVAAPALLSLLFPSLMAGTIADEFVLLTRLLLVQPILLGLSGIWGSVTQLSRRFFLFALSPILYNLGIIAGAVFWYPTWGLTGIGFGVLLGAVLHLMVNVPVLIRSERIPSLGIPRPSELWSVVRDSVPRSLALSLGSLTSLLLVALAARAEEGSVAVFTFASNLSAVPLSLIGAAYATAAFPVMSEQAGDGKHEAFRATVSTSLRHIIFWSSVVAVLVIVLRAHLVRVILGAGAFDWNDTRLTAALLAILIVGLLAQGITLLTTRAFYAAGKTWNPFCIQAFGAVLSVASAWTLWTLSASDPYLGYVMEALLRIEGIPGSAVVFVALGAMLGQVVMGVLSLLYLSQVAGGVARQLVRPLFDGLAAAIMGGAAAYAALTYMGTLAPLTTLPTVFAQGFVAGMVGLIVAGAVLALLENQEFRSILSALKKLTSTKALPAYAPIHDRTDT